ncbi:Leucine Rich Repeat family protein [Histomonas meleagridis]|uniref:Leucine Rich Repeat family protein n=1 Tax=Histomonas meleagridis TaxID=135588 RepID=UPI0035599B00|nr:Leucine Rich Repeat family protein [Histomonas meleagridis]KAH0796187.1 Leucine Rich Repeat family protein [Histomonas meleagridis]
MQAKSIVQSPPYMRGIARLRARLYAERPTVPEDLIETYEEFLKSGNNNLDFSQIAVQHYYVPLFDSLLIIPHVTSIELPTTETAHWKEVGSFLSKSSYISSFTTSERIDAEFPIFLEEIKKCSNKVLKSVTFSCPKITESDITTIVGIVQQCELNNLTIVHSLNRHCIDILCGHLSKVKSLKSLTIDHVEHIDPIKVICTLPDLEYFGCPHSECELCSIFQTLSTLTDISLKTLNFSGNSFKETFKKQFTLPRSIHTLILDDVDFLGTSFENLFLKMILKNPIPLSVSIKRFKIDRSQWLSFQKKITQCVEMGNLQMNLQELYWEGNSLYPNFFSFLEKCKPLTCLSLNGCLNGSETKTIKNLTEFISSTLCVTDLRISGSDNKKISPESLISILNALKNDNRTIRKLDISGNKMDEKVFETLGEVLMSNRAIEYIDFTNSGVTDSTIFTKFFSILLQRGKPLNFPFPISDINKMEKDGLINKDTIKKLRLQADKIINGNPSVQVPLESIRMPSTPITATYQVLQMGLGDQSSDSSDDEEWSIFPAPVPPIDNYEIESVISDQFSLQKIVERIRNH